MSAVSRREFVDAELESLGSGIAAMENRHGISIKTIDSWTCLKSQPMLEYMLNTSRGVLNKQCRNTYRDHVGAAKRIIDGPDFAWSANKSRCLPKGATA